MSLNFQFLVMFERNPLAVNGRSFTGQSILDRQEGGKTQSQIASMCETGGLTQKQSLRGLLLRHLINK